MAEEYGLGQCILNNNDDDVIKVWGMSCRAVWLLYIVFNFTKCSNHSVAMHISPYQHLLCTLADQQWEHNYCWNWNRTTSPVTHTHAHTHIRTHMRTHTRTCTHTHTSTILNYRPQSLHPQMHAVHIIIAQVFMFGIHEHIHMVQYDVTMWR